MNEVPHTKMLSVSIIRQQLWDKAKWHGVNYSIAPGSPYPPIMGLMFKSIDEGMKIFKKWREEYGEKDEKEAIRVAVVRDIDEEFPDDYRVGISANPATLDIQNKLISSATRITTMNPRIAGSLDMFAKQYELVGEFMLAPVGPDENGDLVIRNDLGVIKKEIIIKRPHEVGDNDPDSVLVGKSRKD